MNHAAHETIRHAFESLADSLRLHVDFPHIT